MKRILKDKIYNNIKNKKKGDEIEVMKILSEDKLYPVIYEDRKHYYYINIYSKFLRGRMVFPTYEILRIEKIKCISCGMFTIDEDFMAILGFAISKLKQ